MARIPDVVPHTKIVTAWGNLVRDRTITPFVNAAERDAAWPAPPTGALCVLVNEGAVQVYLGTWQRIGSDVPVGSIIMHSAPTPPDDFILCNGASYPRAVYPELFTVISTRYGVGTSSDNTTFNVPNLVDRVPVGASGTRPLGSAAGEAVHTISGTELPQHAHTTGNDLQNHQHGVPVAGAHGHTVGGGYFQPVIAVSIGSGVNQLMAAGQGTGALIEFTSIDGVGNHDHGATAGVTANHTHNVNLSGGSAPMSLMQPYQTVNYIIRAST